MSETALATVEDFLACKRIAIVGVSRNPRDFSRALMREMLDRGYQVVPVNPSALELDGHRCYPRLAEISLPIDGVLVMTSAETSGEIVRECIEAGIRRVWVYRGTSKGAVSPQAVELCREHGISVVAGECPFMFLPRRGWVHSLHGMIRRIKGAYPARSSSNGSSPSPG